MSIVNTVNCLMASLLHVSWVSSTCTLYQTLRPDFSSAAITRWTRFEDNKTSETTTPTKNEACTVHHAKINVYYTACQTGCILLMYHMLKWTHSMFYMWFHVPTVTLRVIKQRQHHVCQRQSKHRSLSSFAAATLNEIWRQQPLPEIKRIPLIMSKLMYTIPHVKINTSYVLQVITWRIPHTNFDHPRHYATPTSSLSTSIKAPLPVLLATTSHWTEFEENDSNESHLHQKSNVYHSSCSNEWILYHMSISRHNVRHMWSLGEFLASTLNHIGPRTFLHMLSLSTICNRVLTT